MIFQNEIELEMWRLLDSLKYFKVNMAEEKALGQLTRD
jgi:hypothetical protein